VAESLPSRPGRLTLVLTMTYDWENRRVIGLFGEAAAGMMAAGSQDARRLGRALL
jgi:hypothetical protein